MWKMVNMIILWVMKESEMINKIWTLFKNTKQKSDWHFRLQKHSLNFYFSSTFTSNFTNLPTANLHHADPFWLLGIRRKPQTCRLPNWRGNTNISSSATANDDNGDDPSKWKLSSHEDVAEGTREEGIGGKAVVHFEFDWDCLGLWLIVWWIHRHAERGALVKFKLIDWLSLTEGLAGKIFIINNSLSGFGWVDLAWTENGGCGGIAHHRGRKVYEF